MRQIYEHFIKRRFLQSIDIENHYLCNPSIPERIGIVHLGNENNMNAAVAAARRCLKVPQFPDRLNKVLSIFIRKIPPPFVSIRRLFYKIIRELLMLSKLGVEGSTIWPRFVADLKQLAD